MKRSGWVLALLVSVVASALVASPAAIAAGGGTGVNVLSEAGAWLPTGLSYWTTTPQLTSPANGVISIGIDGNMTVLLAPPLSQPALTVGYYANATTPSTRVGSAPGFEIIVANATCVNSLTDFVIDDIALGPDGAPTRLSARFAQRCNNTVGTVFGSVFVNPVVNLAPDLQVGQDAFDLQTSLDYPSDLQSFRVDLAGGQAQAIGQVSATSSAVHIVGDSCSNVASLGPSGCFVYFVVRPFRSGVLHASIHIPTTATYFLNDTGFDVQITATTPALPVGHRFREDFGPTIQNKVPIVADFNNDGLEDLITYEPGPGSDAVYLSSLVWPLNVQRSLTIGGSYQPLTGDFDGDGNMDVFWYGPGSSADVLWFGLGTGKFVYVNSSVGGVYRPIVADYDSDGATDILWYRPGTGSDVIWYGNSSRTFSSARVTINGNYPYITGGDFNADGRLDLLFWSKTSQRHAGWISNGARGYSPTTIVGSAVGAVPLSMNVDGDARTDLFWYGPGPIADGLTLGANGYSTFASKTVSGYYDPLWGNFDGDAAHRTDIVWWSTAYTNPKDAYWAGTSHGLASKPYGQSHFMWDFTLPFFGDFDGNGATDIWFTSENATEGIFYGIDTDGPNPASPMMRRTASLLSKPAVQPTIMSCAAGFELLPSMCSRR